MTKEKSLNLPSSLTTKPPKLLVVSFQKNKFAIISETVHLQNRANFEAGGQIFTIYRKVIETMQNLTSGDIQVSF